MIGAAGERLKAIDPYLAPPAALVSAAVAMVAGRFRQADPRALIVRPGGMGDLICAQMALETLGQDPRAVLWLIESRSQGWASLQGLPHLSYDTAPVDVVKAITGRHDLVVDTEQLFGLSRVVARLGRRRRGRLVGWSTSRLARVATDVVAYDWDVAHEVAEFARLFAVALDRELPDGPIERPRLEPLAGPPLVAIGGTHSESRTFDAGSWASWVARWRPTGPIDIVAAPVDEPLARAVRDVVGDRATLRPGTFDETCRRVAGAESLLTVDGGMVHVASYFGVPTVAVFTSGRATKWAPLASGSSMVRTHGLSCQPCTRFGQTPDCPYDYRCRAVDWDDLEAVRPPTGAR